MENPPEGTKSPSNEQSSKSDVQIDNSKTSGTESAPKSETPPESAKSPSTESSSEIKSQESPVVPMLPKRNLESTSTNSDTVAMKPISTRVGQPRKRTQNAHQKPSNCCILI